MSYVSDHNCPATKLLINLRNARDIAKSATELTERGVKLDDDALERLKSLVSGAAAQLSDAVALLKEHRPDLD